MNRIQLIKELSNAPGAPGFEEDVVSVIRQSCEENRLGRVITDPMQNVIIEPENTAGNKPVIMLDAHSDEVGFMVQAVESSGIIRFICLGGIHPQVIAGHKLKIRNREGHYIDGIVGNKPPHFQSREESSRLLPVSEMYLDVGASSKEEVTDVYKIDVGAPCIFDAPFIWNSEQEILMGKAFDNRLGVACVLDTLYQLRDEDLPFDLKGVISSQEEVGTRGVKVSVQRAKPDLAIVFEGSPADDTFRGETAQCALKKGPQIRHYDAGMISHPPFTAFARKTARERGIAIQDAVRLGGCTNGAVIHISGEGIPVLVLGIPVRYVHSQYGIASFPDYKECVSLAVEVIRTLKKDSFL